MHAVAGLAGAAIIVATLAAWSDVRVRRIPNRLTLPTMLLGLVAHAVLGGMAGLGSSLAGGAVALALMLPGYCLRFMGGGDIKLMTAIGTLLGFPLSAMAVLGSLAAGGAIALAIAAARGQLAAAALGTARLAGWLGARAVGRGRPAVTTTRIRIAFAPAAVAGTAFATWMGFLR